MGEFFICPRCGNSNQKKVGYKNGKPYCRACITFSGEEVLYKTNNFVSYKFDLKYPLTKEQQDISRKILSNYQNKIDTLLIAVCGAGKTELVYNVMSYALKQKGKVGFAIPRRDVVNEIGERIKEVFTKNKVVCVYGGCTNDLDGDIICLTTHQLYRYNNFFDLLVVDEIDAFPYANNDVLISFMNRSKRGNIVLMTATPSKEILEQFSNEDCSILRLNRRFHHHPLPVPKIYKGYSFLKYIILLKQLRRFLGQHKPVFVFVPTIEMSINIFKFINLFIKNGEHVHSKRENRSEIIKSFKEGKFSYLVTTAVLERGVTVKDLQVIIFSADHPLYDESTLVQISGRVGRKIDAPDGEVIFIVDKISKEIEKCIAKIQEANKDLS